MKSQYTQHPIAKSYWETKGNEQLKKCTHTHQPIKWLYVYQESTKNCQVPSQNARKKYNSSMTISNGIPGQAHTIICLYA